MNPSDESDSEVEIEDIPEEEQKYVKDILEKGKEMAPFYNEATLYGLYKSYYSDNKLFFSELEVIAKRRKVEAENKNEWITVGQATRRGKVGASRYNFLEDKDLIRRAKDWDNRKERQNDVPTRKGYLGRSIDPQLQNHENRNGDQKRIQYREKTNENNTIDEKKDTKYKESERQVKQQKTEKEPEKIKYKEKEEKIEKKKETQVQKQQEKTNQKAPVEKTVPEKKVEQPINSRFKEKPSQEAPKKEEKEKQVQNKPKGKYVQKQVPKVVSQTEAEAKFNEECAKNKHILTYIKPGEKIQKINYIIREGKADEIRTRHIL